MDQTQTQFVCFTLSLHFINDMHGTFYVFFFNHLNFLMKQAFNLRSALNMLLMFCHLKCPSVTFTIVQIEKGNVTLHPEETGNATQHHCVFQHG